MHESSLVHTVETSVQSPERPLYRNVVRRHCRVEWTATEALYRHFDIEEGKDRLSAFYECRTRAWFMRNREDGTLRVAANSCRLRWCPLCSRARTNFIRFQVAEWFQTAIFPKFLTLTVKHTQKPLSEQITGLYSAFRKLRNSRLFREKCTGGIWFFQMCFNPKRHEWHPHLHCILTGKLIPRLKISKLWLQITGDSEVIDIRGVKDPRKVGDYVARYAARPCELSNLPNRQAIEAVTCLHGRRIAGSWGTGGCISFRPKKTPDAEAWEYMGSWTTIHAMAESDERAKAILEAYHRGTTLEEGYSCYDAEQFIDGMQGRTEESIDIDPNPPPLLW